MSRQFLFGGLLALLLQLLSVAVVNGETCFMSNSYYAQCEHGCCGSFPYEECCTNQVPLIVGLAVGGVILMIAVVVVVCIIFHIKANKVQRLVESATSNKHGAGQPQITIFNMNSGMPYHEQERPNTYMTDQDDLPPPGVPFSAFSNKPNQNGNAIRNNPNSSGEPLYPPATQPYVGGGGGVTAVRAAPNRNSGMTSQTTSQKAPVQVNNLPPLPPLRKAGESSSPDPVSEPVSMGGRGKTTAPRHTNNNSNMVEDIEDEAFY